MKKAIVLAGDRGYMEQVTTTLKSILYHTRQVRVYILNTDFPPEWFHMVNSYAQKMGSEVVSRHISSDYLHDDWGTQAHITPIAYARFHIPDLIPEERVLYLDSDIIVNNSLDFFFDVDMQGYPLAAIRDADGSGLNSGVLLIDNDMWREESLADQLVSQARETAELVARGEFGYFNGDQTILNQVFSGRWLELEQAYNLQVGHDVVAFYSGWSSQFASSKTPTIIHYTTGDKPWNSLVGYRYRELWWQFYKLSFERICDHVLDDTFRLISPFVGHRTCFVFTASQDLAHIQNLVESLPDVYFFIAAYTAMGPLLLDLRQYANVRLYPTVVPPVLASLKQTCDVYLDINYGPEVDTIVADMQALGKPVLAFADTAKGKQGQQILNLENMKHAIQGEELAQPLAKVRDINQSLDFILEHHSSVARYGDGEMDIMMGHSIPYQDYDEHLAQELKDIVARQSDERLLVCLSDVFERLERYRPEAVAFWQGHLEHYKTAYQELCTADWYGSTFISRPYMDLADKTPAAGYFAKLKELWEDRDILIVEGQTSRSGVGNDLFDGARSIKRVICPSRNAYQKVDEIQQAIEQYGQGKLILLMLGPTAKVLVHRLSEQGHQAIDIGHIDSEYEWFRMGALDKVKFLHKHTAEHNFDQDITLAEDKEYDQQILVDLS